MHADPETFDLLELSARADVSARTIRYYIQQGLLPSPDARGPGAHYGPEHLDRLHLIKRLQREHLPLAEIRRRLEGMGAAEIARLAREVAVRPRPDARDYIRGVLSEAPAKFRMAEPDMAARHAARPAPPSSALGASVREMVAPRPDTAPKRPLRSQWDRIVLAPDVELHVRRPLSREQNRQVERLMDAARDIFEENAP